MKSFQYIRTLTALGVAGVLLLSGSSARAAGYKLADKVGEGIAEFRDEIVEVKKAVDATMAALDKIVAEATIDPRKAFKTFAKSIPDIDSAAKKARKRADDMRENGKEYFEKWEKDLAGVNNPDVRKLAEERKAKLQASFGNLKTSLAPARDEFTAWLANLKDLEKYLNQDLTISGIDAAKDLFAKSKRDGVAVQQTIDKVISELNSVVAIITPAKVKK